MTAHIATIDRDYDRRNLFSLTPSGWSRESEKIGEAEEAGIKAYFRELPTSRFHFGESGEEYLDLLVAGKDVLNILDVYRSRLPQDFYHRIRTRVDTLIAPAEWVREDELPSPESFRRLLAFLAENRRLRCPSIFLNRQGLFSASWRPEKRKLASLVFHKDNNVSWLVFLPRQDAPADVMEVAGRAPVENVLSELGKHDALGWMRTRRFSFLARLFCHARLTSTR